ncbi:MAG: hypothetical protein WDZ75_01105 [Candidatus Paceibacterota bacterium]
MKKNQDLCDTQPAWKEIIGNPISFVLKLMGVTFFFFFAVGLYRASGFAMGWQADPNMAFDWVHYGLDWITKLVTG